VPSSIHRRALTVAHLLRRGCGPEDGLRAVERPLRVILFKRQLSRLQELVDASRQADQSLRVPERGVRMQVTRISSKPAEIGREDSSHTPLDRAVELLPVRGVSQ
jgi:hypothetical protein